MTKKLKQTIGKQIKTILSQAKLSRHKNNSPGNKFLLLHAYKPKEKVSLEWGTLRTLGNLSAGLEPSLESTQPKHRVMPFTSWFIEYKKYNQNTGRHT